MICALIASLLWDALDAMRFFAKSILILAYETLNDHSRSPALRTLSAVTGLLFNIAVSGTMPWNNFQMKQEPIKFDGLLNEANKRTPAFVLLKGTLHRCS